MTNAEQADLVRSLHRHRGWLEVQEPGIQAKLVMMKDMALAEPSQRPPDITNWSTDKFSGFVHGLAWAHTFLADWLKKYDDGINQQAVAEEEQREPPPQGHPYGRNHNSHAEIVELDNS